jgi:hypothetical protein
MTNRRKFGLAVFALTIFVIVYTLGIQLNWYGHQMDSGAVAAANTEKHRAVESRQKVQSLVTESLGADPAKQILFGDLHVHTSYSLDAYLAALPLMQGEGVHPPADACDFARYCSALDFWSINDHAESLNNQRWMETKQTIRDCNAGSGDPMNPDTVAFLGWEWTQLSGDPENHFGHKNIILVDTAEDKVPTRPVAAVGSALTAMQKAKSGVKKFLLPALDLENRQDYYDFERFIKETKGQFCAEGVDVRDLPEDCIEYAATPAELFAKLRQWGFPTMVIPHGNAVGHHAAPGSSWMNQLTSGNHDPDLQYMIEIYSGHGNSEEYRSWQDYAVDAEGVPYCPPPTPQYTPMCWRAGEIIHERCVAEGAAQVECAEREVLTRRYAARAGHNGHAVVGGSKVKEWLDAGECNDCFLPVAGLRPNNAVQAALAVRNFEPGPGESERFKFAIMSSSDNHNARSGSGFKEVGRHNAADISGPKSQWLSHIMSGMGKPLTSPVSMQGKEGGHAARFTERSRSFVYTGGLVATHAPGRDRQSIWDALQRKEIYGTSGPRIMLWFDLLNGSDGVEPMGSDLLMSETPRFRARAVGAFKQQPGCPDYALDGLSAERLEHLCYGECYNPGDERHKVSRIEVVKITPQNTPDEQLSGLIQDVWKSFDCGSPAQSVAEGCIVEFEDPDFTPGARDSLYYVRAIQEPTPTINGGNLRCEYDDNGQCIEVHPCHIDERTDYSDDCLAPAEHRAWSSPIFVDFDAGLEVGSRN